MSSSLDTLTVYRIGGKPVVPTVGTGSRSGSRTTIKLVCEKADADDIWMSLTPSAWYTTVGTTTDSSPALAAGGYWDRSASRLTMEEAYATIELTFDSENIAGLNLNEGSASRYNPIYTLSTSTEERPIEQHPSFRCRWAYNLYELIPVGGTASAVPAWAATDNNPAGGTRAAPVVRENYLWSRTQPPSPDAEHKYVQVLAAIKYGVDAYLVPRPVVTATIYYRVRAVQQSDIKAVGKLKAPPYGSIYPVTDDTRWLVTNASNQQATDKLIAVTATYTYNQEGYDTDIYQVAT